MEVTWSFSSSDDDTWDTANERSESSIERASHEANILLMDEEGEYLPHSSVSCGPPEPLRRQQLPVELQCEDEDTYDSDYNNRGDDTTGVFVTSSTNFNLQCEDEGLQLYSSEEAGEEGEYGNEDEDDVVLIEAFDDEDLEPILGAALPYRCKKCGVSFQDLSGLQEHRDSHLKGHSYRCSICSKEFSRAPNLRMHKLIHANERPHKCPECDKGFIRTADVWRHLRNVHKIERTKMALDNGNTFRNPWALKQSAGHAGVDGPHPREEEARPCICPTCGKGFQKPNLLSKHKVIHRQDKPYKCLECGMAFVQLLRLKRHQRTHSGERPYNCEECGSTFTRLASLQRHQRIHTGEKPYTCEYCGHCFTELGTLKRHESKHSSENVESVHRPSRDCVSSHVSSPV